MAKALDKNAAPIDDTFKVSPVNSASSLSLATQVADTIRDMILQNILAPGDRIRERTLASDLNVSRTPMREALKVLSAEGLIEILPNRGAVVRNPSPKEIQDMLRVLATLDALAGELTCELATDAELDELQALQFEMRAAFARKDLLGYFKINQKIHRTIVAIANNVALTEIHDRLNARLYRERFQPNLKDENWANAIEEHEDILAAILKRDSAEAARLLNAHLGSTWSKINAALSDDTTS